MAVSIDNRKRSFHVCFSLYRSSTTSLSRPSTRARENCHEEFRNWIDNRYTAPIVWIGLLAVMTSDGNRQVARDNLFWS
jgi:hypothetical protein